MLTGIQPSRDAWLFHWNPVVGLSKGQRRKMAVRELEQIIVQSLILALACHCFLSVSMTHSQSQAEREQVGLRVVSEEGHGDGSWRPDLASHS